MLMVMDVGNTTCELGIFKGDDMIRTFRFITKEKRTSDELGVLLQSYLTLIDLKFQDIDGVIISSVVPDIDYTLNNTILKYFNLKPLFVGPGIKTGIQVRSDNPREVGADRIVDALAAYTLYGGPVLVLNFGTATRYDYVDEKGIFAIAITSPGIQISADALWKNAAKLPNIEIKKPKSILAKNTITSMQAGLVYGYIGQVEYMVRKIQEELQKKCTVVATGGYAKIIVPETDCIDYFDKELTLKGLKLLYDKNTK